jgi:hypothetical protein
MYSVILRKKGKETVGEPLGWGEAYNIYEAQAREVNAVNEKGEYLHPDQRISIRKVEG